MPSDRPGMPQWTVGTVQVVKTDSWKISNAKFHCILSCDIAHEQPLTLNIIIANHYLCKRQTVLKSTIKDENDKTLNILCEFVFLNGDNEFASWNDGRSVAIEEILISDFELFLKMTSTKTILTFSIEKIFLEANLLEFMSHQRESRRSCTICIFDHSI